MADIDDGDCNDDDSEDDEDPGPTLNNDCGTAVNAKPTDGEQDMDDNWPDDDEDDESAEEDDMLNYFDQKGLMEIDENSRGANGKQIQPRHRLF